MKNVLVVGNSHVGSIKRGLDETNLPENIKFTFFALPGPRFLAFKISEKSVVSAESEHEYLEKTFGITSAPLDDYDSILFVAGASRLQFSLYSTDRRVPFLSSAIIEKIVKNTKPNLFNSLRSIVEPSKLFYLGSPLLPSEFTRSDFLRSTPLLSSSDEIQRAHNLASKIRYFCDKTIDDSETFSILLPPVHLLDEHQFKTLDKYMIVNNGHAKPSYGKELSPCILNHI